MPPLARDRSSQVPGGDRPLQREFREALASGDESACRQILREQIESGSSASEAAECLITDAMQGLGKAWQQHGLDPYQERRGCDICIRLINELRRQIPELPSDAPYAFGGTPSGDPYQLPTAMVELALREIGWNAVSIGSNLPLKSFQQAAHDQPPRLVWLSVSAVEDAESFIDQENQLADLLGESVPLVVGGRALTDAIRPRLKYTAHCDSVGHLVELAAMFRLMQ
jgi:methanogenic corrinoid protein MtbC1